MNSPRRRKGGISSFGSPPPLLPPACHPSMRVTKFALRFYTPPPPSPAYPTMIQPLLIALPHYCPTFMALPHYHPFDCRPHPSSCHPPADVTYYGRRPRGRCGMRRSLVEKGARFCRCAGGAGGASLPGFRKGASHPNLGRGGGGAVPREPRYVLPTCV